VGTTFVAIVFLFSSSTHGIMNVKRRGKKDAGRGTKCVAIVFFSPTHGIRA
jgi:hypothetical protein